MNSIIFVVYSIKLFENISKTNPESYDLKNEWFKLKVRENIEQIKFL